MAHQAGEAALAASRRLVARLYRGAEPGQLPRPSSNSSSRRRSTGGCGFAPCSPRTPDVYSGAVLDLVRGAKKTLYIQTQYAHASTSPKIARSRNS